MSRHFDPHRFGLKVQFLENPNGSWFQKPRSIWVEKLFLDPHSEFNLFPIIFKTTSPFEFEEFPSYGESRSINPYCVQKIPEDEVKPYSNNLGRLLAFNTFFGINDLHKENIKIIRWNEKLLPVPVDLENCMVNLQSCSETLLIPSKIIDVTRAGLNGQLKDVFPLIEADNLLDGFIDAFRELMKLDQQSLISRFSKYKSYPQRVILRDTIKYYNLLDKKEDFLEDSSLLPAEIFQLQTGDIPYFFTDKESCLLRYYLTPEVTGVASSGHFREKLDRYTISVEDFFSRERLERLYQTSSTHLVRLLKSNYKKWTGINFRIETRANDTFILHCDDFTSQGKL